MIAQGTDGLSRGSSLEDIMQGNAFMSFVPLHLSAEDRQGHLLTEWVRCWFGVAEELTWLSPEGWFHSGHHETRCVWYPPPTVAEAALEQLAKAIHKQPQHMHLILVPRLMTAHWRKLLGKICTLTFTVPAGSDFWSISHFEPLMLALFQQELTFGESHNLNH